MDMQGALRARLVVAATAVGARVYWVDRPQTSALPAITLQTISGDRSQTYDGFQGWRAPRVQMDVWAASYAEVRTVLEAAVTALAPREISNGIKFDAMGFEGESDSIEDTGSTTIYRTRIDLLVRHEPA